MICNNVWVECIMFFDNKILNNFGIRDGFQTTYKELKPLIAHSIGAPQSCFQTTYKELKLLQICHLPPRIFRFPDYL